MNTPANTQKNRSDLVFHELKKDIMTLALKPGQLLSEIEICERFGVSRTPVRDALRLLQEQGFVNTVPYRGIFVTLLNYDYIKQLVYMRFAVETRVIRDFMAIKTPLLMEEINHLIRKQEAIIKDPGFRPEQFSPLDIDMHSIWFQATHTEHLWQILQEQELHYRRFKALDMATETNFPRIIADHKAIFKQIEQAKIEEMEIHLHNHLYHPLTRMNDIMGGEFKDYFE